MDFNLKYKFEVDRQFLYQILSLKYLTQIHGINQKIGSTIQTMTDIID